MNRISQVDSRWRHQRLGTGRLTIGQVGCFLSCLSMLSYKDILEVNQLLIDRGGFANGDMMISSKAAKILDLKYDGITVNKPDHICVAETKHFAPRVPQHFFVFAPQGTVSPSRDLMLDPLSNPATMDWQPVKYKVKTYRLFHEKEVDEPIEDSAEWKEMLEKGIFSEHTKHGHTPPTDELAIIISRTLRHVEEKIKEYNL